MNRLICPDLEKRIRKKYNIYKTYINKCNVKNKMQKKNGPNYNTYFINREKVILDSERCDECIDSTMMCVFYFYFRF